MRRTRDRQGAASTSFAMKRLTGGRTGGNTRRNARNSPRTRALLLEALEHRTLLANTPIISEFMAENNSGITDQFNNRSDWIEIYNPTDAAVNLDGWALTDEAGDAKWTFPNHVLGPNQYFLVFASGTSRKIAGQPYHADFRLNTEGEYLGLLMPDGTVASDFGAQYPPQVPDVSYGLGQDVTSTTLLGPQAPAKVFVPPDGSLGTNWTQTDFVDSSWTNAATGIGYDQGQAAGLPNEVEPNNVVGEANNATENFRGFVGDVYQMLLTGQITAGDTGNSGTLGDWFQIGTLQPGDVISLSAGGLASARGLLGDPQIELRRGPVSGTSVVVADSDGGVGADALIHRFAITATDTYWVRVTSQLDTTGTYQAGIWLENTAAAPSTGSGTVAEKAESNNGPSLATNATAGWARVQYLSRTAANQGSSNDYYRYQLTAGDLITVIVDSTAAGASTLDVKLSIRDSADAVLASFDGSAEAPTGIETRDGFVYAFRVPASGAYYVRTEPPGPGAGAGNYNTDVYLSTTTPPPTGALFTPLIQTDIGSAMANRSSAYVRIPFNVTDPTLFEVLTLRMKYDDAFVAYLNGEEVAGSTNAPDPAVWNSTATSNRPASAGVVFEDFDLTASMSALRAGLNVLSIHGINFAATGDTDFLVLSQVDGASLETSLGVQRYFRGATPRGPNGTGVNDLGPAMGQVGQSPSEPTDNQNVVVTAKVEQALDPVSSVRLTYRVMYGSEVTVDMFDNGAGGDAVAGDGVYSSTIPASASTPGQMVRYYVTARDSQSRESRWPLPQGVTPTAQYQGFVIPSNEANLATTKLPVFYWYAENTSAANTASGTRGSVYYLGEFYDNVFIRRRGAGTTAGNKFEFTPDHDFRFDDDEARVDQININSRSGRDAAGVRPTLSFETFEDAGSLSLLSFQVRMQLNGTFQKIGIFIEQPDADFLRRNGLYEDSSRYKMTVDHEPMTNAGLFEKKNRDAEGRVDLQDFLNSIQPTNVNRTAYIWDNFDVIGFLSYWASNQIVNDNDDYRKNYYLMRDTREAANPDGTNQWFYAPWDKDLTFGVHFGITDYAAQDPQTHPLFGDGNHRKNDSGSPMVLNDLLLKDPRIKQMYLRRLRTLMDQMLGAPTDPTPVNQRYFEKRLDELHDLMVNEIPVVDRANFRTFIDDIKTRYIAVRRNHLYVNHSQNTSYPDFAGIPSAQPANVMIDFETIEFLTASNNPLQEYIELRNPNAFAVDISDWKLSGGIDYKFRPGTVIAANDSLYVAKDQFSFRARTAGPRGGQQLFITGGYDGQLSSNGETLVLTDNTGRQVRTIGFPGNPSAAQNQLRITEVMFNPEAPPQGSPYANEDFEYIELQNIGATPLNLTGVHFETGVTFNFTSGSLTPGAYTVIVRNVAAFQSRYGTAIPIGGTFVGALDNAGEDLELQDARNEKIVNVDYQNDWYDNAGNGEGFSLVVRNTGTPWNQWDTSEAWRPSELVDGNPGAADTGINPNSVVISEVMPNGSAATGGNWIELRNTTNQPIDVGGWFLSDTKDNLRKWSIPPNTFIPANGHVSFGQNGVDGFGGGFTLSALGGDVFLAGNDGLGNLAGYRDGVDFDGAAPDVSFGRYIKSTGASDFVAQKFSSRDQLNGAPAVGPVVITEMMYRPRVGQHEFVELRNISGATVPLAGWAFTDGITFTFPAGAQMVSSETILVVPIAPATFRTIYNIPAAVQIFGPYTGVLSGGGEGVTLSRPGTPVGDQTPMIRMDRVSYEDDLPWPAAADGSGPSLARVINPNYGNDVANWRAESTGGTPGQPNTGAPYAMFAGIEYGPSSPRVVIRFSENVASSIASNDLTITRLSDNQTISAVTYAYNPATFTATWTLPATLLDGNYRLSINAGSIVDGTSLALDGDLDGQAGGNLAVQTHHLSGDLNQDRTVDHFDFATLYANFGKTAQTFSGGDLNFDGRVNFTDFQIMERQFGKTLTPAPAAPVSAPAPAPVPVKPAPTPKAPAPKSPAPASVSAPAATTASAAVFSAKRIQPPKRRPVEILAGT